VLWTEAAFSACLAWHWPNHHCQSNWRVVWTSSHMCQQKADTSSKYCDNIQLWQETFQFLSNVSRFVDCFFKLPQIRTSNFCKVVRQHTEGMVESIIWVLLKIYFSFQQWKNLKNPLRIDKVIAMSLVYYFFWDTVYCIGEEVMSFVSDMGH